MAHLLETMVYTGKKPWHDFGVYVRPNMTPQEMQDAADLNWTVSKREMFFGNGSKVPDSYAIVRDSDESFFGICGERFKIMQNSDGFEFFSEFVKAGNMEMETAGSIDGGRAIFGCARMRNLDFAVANNNDEIESYMLMTIPHEYGKSIYIMFTPVRVVCNNTLQMALNGKGVDGVFRMTHGTQWSESVKESAIETLGLSAEKQAEFKESAEFLASKRITDEMKNRFFATLYQPNLEDISNKDGWNRQMKRMEDIFHTQPGAELSDGTFWTAFNAVTYFTDHMAGRSADTRVKSAMVGVGAGVKRKALALAVDMAKAA